MSEVRFGAYRVTEALGSGAIATLYKAVQEPLGRVVALKVLKTQIAPTSSFAEQLDREAKILRELSHPNVVLLLDAGRSAAGRPFLVLESIDGPSLEELLAKRRTLSVEEALAVALGIVAALEHVHDGLVVHRDVKPSNVLLTRRGVVKLIDFGIAQRARTTTVDDPTSSEGITPSGRLAPAPVKDAFGTPAYMSPEQILGDFVDGRSDLFSLGVVLYQLLSGGRPFEVTAKAGEGGRASRPPAGVAAAGDRSAAQRIRRDAPAPLRDRAPHVPRSVDRLVMRLLEKAPSERYGDARAVHERLERELRALTRDEPRQVIVGALVAGGFLPAERKVAGTASASRARRGVRASRALLGQALVLLAFVIGVLAIEGGSLARGSHEAAERPLELLPDQAGGLRVLATPWATVRVDGQMVETTPFARPIPLSPGKHWVTLEHPDAPRVEREVTAAVGETTTLDVTMAVGSLDDAGTGTGRSAR
jgi:serine/threonine-protein kinase